METLTKEESKQIMLDYLNEDKEFLRSIYFSEFNDNCCIIGNLLKKVSINNNDKIGLIYFLKTGIDFKKRLQIGTPTINNILSNEESLNLFGIEIDELLSIQCLFDKSESKDTLIKKINAL